MRRLLVIGLVLLGAAALYFSGVGRNGSAQAVTWKTAPVTVGNVTARVTATGSLQAVTRISVGSEVSGRILRLSADFNSRVRKGQVLAELDPATFQAQVEQQEANLSEARAAYDSARANAQNLRTAVDRAEAGILGAQALIESAWATLASARAGMVTARANEERARVAMQNSQVQWGRQENLARRDLVARSETDTARATYLQDQANLESLRAQSEAAQASYRSAQAALDARRADLQTALSTRDGARAQALSAAAQVRSAAARVRSFEANLRQTRVNLERTLIRSPIDGIVLDRKVTIGQTVAAQFQAPDLFTLAENLDQMQVEVAVDEADIGQVRHGAEATFTVDAYPNQTFSGTVTEVRQAPVNTQNVITYTVIIRTRNPQGKLMPGMTATVGIEVGTHHDVLLVPNAALRFTPPPGLQEPRPSPREGSESKPGDRRKGPSSRLFTLDPQTRKPVYHRVKTGLSDGVNTEVEKGELKVGDEVILDATLPGARPSPTSGGSRRSGSRMF